MEQGNATENGSERSLLMKEEELEKETWRCLNSVDHLLRRREILHLTLRQGWMELVSARYEMGPARVSQPLLSLKPQAGKAVVDISLNFPDEVIGGVPDDACEEQPVEGHVVFHLIKDKTARELKAEDKNGNYSDFRKAKPSSQLRRRPVSILADDEKNELLQYRDLISDSDSEDDSKPLEVQKNNLQGFGTLVSPHLRAAQGTFLKALQLVVELLNVQNEAIDAHSKISRFQNSTDSSFGSEEL